MNTNENDTYLAFYIDTIKHIKDLSLRLYTTVAHKEPPNNLPINYLFSVSKLAGDGNN